MITVNLVDCWLVVELALGKYGASCDIMWEMAVHNEVAKVMFLHVSVCSQGQYLGRYHSPGPRYTSPDQVHPPGTRYTPWTKYTPWEQVHTPGTRYTPGPGAHPPEPGTPPGPDTPLQTRYSPLDQVLPPWDQVHPLDQVQSLQDQVHPLPRHQVPPLTMYIPWTRYTPQGQVTLQTRYTPQEMADAANGTHPTGLHSCEC